MQVNMSDLMSALRITGQGMLGIFAVLIAISLLVLLLAKLTNKKDDE